ncbi:hypothetical protein EBR56_07950 [bacterium]|nr:hypothetical protein [bacterium]
MNQLPRYDCIVCGTCAADILVKPVGLAAPIGGGRLFEVDPIDVTTGGIVCNSGIAMRRLGLAVAAASIVGADVWGSVVRQRLEAEGIGAGAVESDARQATSSTAVLIDPSGERSFAHHVGACREIDVAYLRRQAGQFADARFALLGYFGILPGLEPAIGEAVAVLREAGCQVALETGGSGGSLAAIAPALQHVDLYVPSLDEAIHQTGLSDPREILATYRGHGLRGVAGVKLGSRGTLLSPRAGEFLEIPCVPAPGPVADTTGAGDSLLAGLITGILRGMPLDQAGRLGSATAACCVTGVGATAGLRSFEETVALAGAPLRESS